MIKQHSEAGNWVLIHGFRREQGLLYRPGALPRDCTVADVFNHPLRWSLRQAGAGAQRFLMEQLSLLDLNADDLESTGTALSDREAAASVAMGIADIAPGARAAATEYGLHFIAFGWESFDLVIPRPIWFRRLFQQLVQRLKSPACQQLADRLTGYDLGRCGELVWGDE